MISSLTEWVRTTAAAAVFCGVALLLVPEESEKKAARLVCALVMTLLLIRPLRSLDTERLSRLLSIRNLQETRLLEETDELSIEVCRSIIQDKTEEYIWDAAARLGISRLGIRLRLSEGGDLPCPWSIDLTGEYTDSQQERLSLLLEGELGIPRERQTWSMEDAG